MISYGTEYAERSAHLDLLRIIQAARVFYAYDPNLARRIEIAVRRGISSALTELITFIRVRLKSELSVPSPRQRITSASQLTTQASRTSYGVPMRMVTGRARDTVMVYRDGETGIVIRCLAKGGRTGQYPRGFPYPWYHEIRMPRHIGSGRHPWIKPTIEKIRPQLIIILSRYIREAMRDL